MPSHNVLSRRAYSQRSADRSLGKDELSFLERRVLDPPASNWPVQSKMPMTRQSKKKDTKTGPQEALDRGSDLFSKKSVRRLQDKRSTAFDPVSRNLTFSSPENGDLDEPQNEVKEASALRKPARKKAAGPEKVEKEQSQIPREQEEQALLLAVWQQGIDKAPLPRHLETIRRKYKMAGPEYRRYWRHVAASLLTGEEKVPGASDKARQFLRRLEERKGTKHVVPAEHGPEHSHHKKLMDEARLVAEELRKGDETEALKTPEERTRAPTMEKQTHGGKERESTKTEDGEREGQERNLTKRQKWRLNKEQAALEARKRSERRAILETKSLRLADKQIWVTNTMRELERHRKIREMSERRSDVKVKIRDLLETLAIEEENQQEAEEARTDAERAAEEQARRREGLDHLLDDALARAGIRKDVADNIPKRDGANAPSHVWGLNLNPDGTIKLRQVSEEDAREEVSSDITQPTSTPATSEGISHSESPSADLGPGEIFIDPGLTITLNADTKTLQKQFLLLENRLGASYPRMDVMPYTISKSENRNTLQTWLRIFARRWKSRHDAPNEMSTKKAEVKAVLDQMVRDHDLSNEAAKRMAKRWSEITQKRAEVADDVDEAITSKRVEVTGELHEALDMDEFHAGGMGFLSAGNVEEDVDFAESDIPSAAEEVSLAAQNAELDVGTLKREEEPDTVDVGPAAPKRAKSKAKLKTDHATKDVTSATNPVIRPSRKQNNVVDDSIAKRLYSTSSRPPLDPSLEPSTSTSPAKAATPTTPTAKSHLPHLTSSGSAHMVSVSSKAHTVRTAIAVGFVHFSNPTPLSLMTSASLKKGDVLAVSRIAGIMAAKKCPDLIPLCHPIALTHVGVELRVLDAQAGEGMGFGGVSVEAKVQCTGPTGVEMEALTAVMGATLSVVDMCKAVDKFQRVQDVRVVLKEGGKSGVWKEEGWVSSIGGESE